MTPTKITQNKGMLNSTKDAIKVIADAANKAADKIDIATERAATLLANAAEKAVTALAHAAKDANELLASNTAEAMKVSNTAEAMKVSNTASDHDLLIRLETKLEGIREDIKDLKDGTSKQIADHEMRLGSLESSKTRQNTLMSIGIGLLSLLVGIILFHLFKI